MSRELLFRKSPNRSNLIIVSNRLPVSIKKENGELIFNSSSGGLAVAMSSIEDEYTKKLWVGWPGINSDELTASEKKEISSKLWEMGCYPVFLTEKQVKKFYSGYANDTIWPLFHYFQSYTQHNSDYWSAYKEVNELYTKEVLKNIDNNTNIWVHDYHLMLLPKLLRDKKPDASIGFFLHTPFPSYEVFRQLSHGDQLLRGILGSDLIGFHIYDYVRHFLTSVLRSIGDDSKYGILNVDGRMVKADAFPIGIDFERFSTAPKGKETKNFLKNLKKYYKNQKIILSVDRLDYSKGIIKRLEAYEQLLANNKELQGKVTMIILAVPSRSDVDTYKELRDNIELYVSRINGLFSTINWSPINYQYKNTPFDELIALYRLADIALVTPLRDGMNLVAKEYVAANKDSSGVLILSEMAGAADELLEAVKINPNDTDSIEDAIKKALVMPIKEQKSRIKAMNYRISKYTVQKWGQDFIEELRDIKQVQKEKEMTHIDEEKINDIKSSFNKAKKRTILLDYDGTLVNLRKNHKSSIKPDKKLTSTLNNLVSLRNTEVYIISGRPHKLIQKWLGKIRNLNLIAEHGAWRKTKGKWSKSPESIDSYKKLILPIMEKITERTPGSDIEVKTTSIVWHYRMVPTELAYIRKMNLLRELHKVVDNSKLSIRQGSKIIEVKPVSVNKGKIVTKILSDRPSDFVLCLGDDYTDEDMFNVLPKSAYTIKVGYESTDARYWIRDVESVLDLLEGLGNKKRSVIKSIKPVVKKGLKTISAKK